MEQQNPGNMGIPSGLPPTNSKTSQNSTAKKPKKKHGCLIAFLIFIGIILLIIGIIVGVNVYKNHKAKETMQEELKNSLSVIQTDEFIKQILPELNNPSDIEGMTRQNKLDMGLVPWDNADTDGDGLTDKEEIEIYHTDPKLASTAGDMVSDKYKIDNNINPEQKLDIKKVYDNPLLDGIEFQNQSSENVGFGIKKLENYNYNGLKPYLAFRINDYTGKLEIDLSKYAEIPENAKALLIPDSSFEEIKEVKISGNKAKIDLQGNSYVLCIAEFPDDIFKNLNSLADFGGKSPDGQGRILMIYSPIKIAFAPDDTSIWIKQEAFMPSMMPDFNDSYNERINKALYSDISVKTEHEWITPYEMSTSITILEYFLSPEYTRKLLYETGMEKENIEETSDIFEKIKMLFINYTVFDNMEDFRYALEYADQEKENEDDKEISEEYLVGTTRVPEGIEKDSDNPYKPAKSVSSFNVYYDALCFPNIGTEISPGGNCAGIAWITAAIFNGNPMEKKGSYTTDDGVQLSYDCNDMPELDTLFDKGLHDYKTRSYWDDTYPELHKKPLNDLDLTDREFVRFIGTKLHEHNETAILKGVSYYDSEPEWSTVDRIVKYFESGNKIGILSILDAKSGHAVNALGIYQDPDDPDVYWIPVYDNNFPDNNYVYKNGAILNLNPRVKLIRETHLIGADTFEWEYAPIPNSKQSNYRFDSYSGIKNGGHVLGNALQLHRFEFEDEELNNYIDKD